MEFKLYPCPTEGVCTPYLYIKKSNAYMRYTNENRLVSLVSTNNGYEPFNIVVLGAQTKDIIGNRKPDRIKIVCYLKKANNGNRKLLNYVTNTYVIPTFSLSPEEAFTKVVIRQLINAKQAKYLISKIIKKCGYNKNGVYNFPDRKRLSNISLVELKDLRLGFKAVRIKSGIKSIGKYANIEMISNIRGLGLWSKQILEVDNSKDYSAYPFWDKSGDKIHELLGIDIFKMSKEDKTLAADLYIYAASYLEAMK